MKTPTKKLQCLREVLEEGIPVYYRQYEVPGWTFKFDYQDWKGKFIRTTTRKIRKKKIRTAEIYTTTVNHPLVKYLLLLAPDCEDIEKFKDLKATFGPELTVKDFVEAWMARTAFYEIAEEIAEKANFLGKFSTPLGEAAKDRLTFDQKAEAVLKYVKSFFRSSAPLVNDFPADGFLVYCPICNSFVEGSPYLRLSVFPDDEYAYWIAALVTHYRHHHIQYYDKTLSNPRYGEKNKEFQTLGEDYDAFKEVVNNRAKRQIIRAILRDDFLDETHKENLIRAVLRLQNNDDKTIELVEKTLAKLKRPGKKKRRQNRLFSGTNSGTTGVS
ncbi:hypothetical protein CL1_0697 [Thermococcus cleftensis]|uniref:Uncharacterized protein n=1 Tax=Thermococcus cleftensis (strain DSM 27260 / KACC 17922 / CL1) TaxID=163003 RepID=I3ZT68_THECF|nr:flagellar protein FliT [Thermococcus cleftensis]AFL94902.1 hypothetical protein CL1_0697 [Thermococcus cleftensis]